jgi:uncharacterized membrane protein YgcG
MRPAPQLSAGRLDSSRAGLFKPRKPLSNEHPEPDPSNATVSPKPICFAASFALQNGGRNICMSMKLYVGNLSFQTTRQDLETAFAQAGTVESVNVIEDRDTGRSRGFAFVEMSTKVNEAKPRENRGGGGGFGGGNRNGFGGNRGGNRGGSNGGGGGYREPRW